MEGLSDSDDDLELSEMSEEEAYYQANPETQADVQQVVHGSESDFNLADASPVPKKKKTKKKKTELVEESKDGQVYRSAVKTRSALKAERVDRMDADTVAEYLASTRIDAVMH